MTPQFSERIRGTPILLQVGSMDEPLRNSIWNLIRTVLPDDDHDIYKAASSIAFDVFRVPVDEIPRWSADTTRQWLRTRVQKLDWSGVYDLLEFVVQNAGEVSAGRFQPAQVRQATNGLLQREHAGYRFVGEHLEPITNPAEIAEIETALRNTEGGFAPARTHLDAALGLLAKRPDPDYRNAVKEAMSAVEALVKRTVGVRGGGLPAALKEWGTAAPFHPAFRDALSKLYGYTSDADGIRHALLDESKLDDADARFMVIACSAFVNFIISKTGHGRLT